MRNLKDLYKLSSRIMPPFTLSQKKLSKSLSTSAIKTNSVSTSTIVFDIETNALRISDITKIHCCALNDGGETKLYKDPKEWIPILEEADVLVGHNIIQYDLVCIKHLYPEFNPEGS